MANFNNTKSFTLIELHKVFALIVVLSSTSLVMISGYRGDRELLNEVSIFTSALVRAKNMAAAGDVTRCSTEITPHVSGHSVVVNSTNITILPSCDTSPSPINYPIPTNIGFLTPSASISFGSQNYQGITRTFPLKNISTNKCKFVQIDETGLITNGDYTCP